MVSIRRNGRTIFLLEVRIFIKQLDSINFRQQAAFLWQSALATGNVASYSTIDLQVNADLLKILKHKN
jgi:hypothetical protein